MIVENIVMLILFYVLIVEYIIGVIHLKGRRK